MPVGGPYRVILSSDAWKKVGLIPGGTFAQLQQALEHVANELGSVRPVGEDSQSELRMNVQGLTVLYQRDDAARTLTLVDILQAPKERLGG